MATRTIAFKVINARKVSFAPLAADLAIGYTNDAGKFVGLFIVPDFILKKSPTKGYYFSAPSKPYIKNGEQQKDDNGYNRYLEFFKLYMEEGASEPGKVSPTKEAFEARKYLIGLFVEALNQLGGDTAAPAARAPRQAARTTATAAAGKATRPATAKTAIEEEEVPFPGGDEDEDDSCPF